MENKVIKSSIWYLLGDVLVKVVTFALTPIFTRILTKSEYGNVANFMAWYSIFSIIATATLHASIGQARLDYRNQKYAYVKSILLLEICWALIIYLIVLLLYPDISIWVGMSKNEITIMFACILFSQGYIIYKGIQAVTYHYKKIVILNLVIAILTVMISLGLLKICKTKAMARILGEYLPSAMIGLGVFFYYIIARKEKPKIEFGFYALKICVPFIPHLLSLNILMNMDRIAINSIWGAENAAIYSLAYSCALIISILLQAMNNAVSPWMGEKLYEKKYEDIRSFSQPYVMFFIMSALLFMIWGPEVIYILGGKSYIDAKYVMAPLVMSCIFQFVYTMYVNIEQYSKKTVGMALASVIAAVTNVLLNAFFIPRFGYVAAAYTTLLSYGILVIIHMLMVRKMGLLHVFCTKRIFVILVIALGSMFAIMYLYSMNNTIRYLISGFLTVTLCIGIFKLFYRIKNMEG